MMAQPVGTLPQGLLTMPLSGAVVMLLALIALAFAYTMQLAFGYEPCVLCLWQRLPYAVVIALGCVALLGRPFGRHTQTLLALCALAFLIECGLAIFHSGVERQWWLGTTGCSIHHAHTTGGVSLREQLLHTPTASCDEISWSLFGFSMANYNVIYALVATVFAFVASRSPRLRFRYKP